MKRSNHFACFTNEVQPGFHHSRGRIPDPQSLQRETLAWEQRRNIQLRTIDWRFTTEDARIKLKRLYPSFQP